MRRLTENLKEFVGEASSNTKFPYAGIPLGRAVYDNFKEQCYKHKASMRGRVSTWVELDIAMTKRDITQKDIWRILHLVCVAREVTSNSKMSLSDVVEYAVFLIRDANNET